MRQTNNFPRPALNNRETKLRVVTGRISDTRIRGWTCHSVTVALNNRQSSTRAYQSLREGTKLKCAKPKFGLIGTNGVTGNRNRAAKQLVYTILSTPTMSMIIKNVYTIYSYVIQSHIINASFITSKYRPRPIRRSSPAFLKPA